MCNFLAVSVPLASTLPFVPSAVPLRKGYNGVQTHLQLPSFPSLCSLLTRPPSLRGRSLRGGLAHQSNASLIVAAVWASVQTIGKRKRRLGGLGGEQKDPRVGCLTALRANDSSTDAQGEAGTRPCVSPQTGGQGGVQRHQSFTWTFYCASSSEPYGESTQWLNMHGGERCWGGRHRWWKVSANGCMDLWLQRQVGGQNVFVCGGNAAIQLHHPQLILSRAVNI